MDDLVGASFFDYAATPHSTISSGLDIQNSCLESGGIKTESFDTTAWIQGCSEISSSVDHGFTATYHAQGLKTSNFLQTQSTSYEPSSLEHLILAAPAVNTQPVGAQSAPVDPLEMILNQPSLANVKREPKDLTPNFLTTGAETHNQSLASSDNLSMQNNSLNDSSGLVIVEEKTLLDSSCVAGEETATTGNPQGNVSGTPVDAVEQPQKEIDPEKDLNLYITNVVSSFRVRCHLNLRKIAREGINVIYQRETKKVVMRIRQPSCTAYVWSSGKVVCTGASSEIAAKKAARKFARRLQSLGFEVVFSNFKVINVLAVCKMPYHIDIVEFSDFHRSKHLSYEPELHPAVTYRIPEWRVTFKIFSTGSITLTCPVVARIPEAVKRVYPMIKDFFRFDKPNDLVSTRKASAEAEEDEEDLS